MPKPTYASVALDVDLEAKPRPTETRSETPFRILLLGDFSGRANRGEPSPARLRPYLIDRDNFDEVLSRVRPVLELGEHGRSIVLRFRELEDFHPDRIFERHPVFEKLREERRSPGSATRKPAPPAPPPDVGAISGGSLLDDMVDAIEHGPAAPQRQPDPLRDFIERAIAPHLVSPEDPRHAASVADADTAAGNLMRAILHHRDFQALEAGWRAVNWLVRGLETGPQLKVYVLDVCQADLPGCLPELHRLLVDQAAAIPGAEPWALVAGNFTFHRSAGDIHLLGELAKIMQAADAPLLAEADPAAADSEEALRLWQALRRSPEARFIGLALPRFLLRLPYGEQTDTLESFPFEEMPGAPVHGEYLWGNPAFACAYLLGEAFSSEGWDLRPGAHRDIKGLPLHVYEEDGEKQLKPCAEVLMTDRDADSLLEGGFMPLASMKNQDAALLVRFQSIADPLAALAGRWD
jgi:type VI secretion system protein ImpC